MEKSTEFLLRGGAVWVQDRKEKLDPNNPVGYLNNFLIHSQKLHDKGDSLHCFTGRVGTAYGSTEILSHIPTLAEQSFAKS